LNTFVAELHVHTVLSPCAEIEMVPPLIVQAARAKGINLIAITDHNASANVSAVQEAAIGSELTVLAGMELQTREEVHLLCLFDTSEQLEAWQSIVDANLPAVENNPEFFGEQFVVDASGDFVRRESRLLAGSSQLSFSQAVQGVIQMGGLAIPAHVNRQLYGLIPVLGFVPTDVPIMALEISRHLKPEQAVDRFPQIKGYPLVQGGDVHQLDSYLGANMFALRAPTIAEIKMALLNQNSRSLILR
jgi:PHP family Zn ribbon phosphoesterase